MRYAVAVKLSAVVETNSVTGSPGSALVRSAKPSMACGGPGWAIRQSGVPAGRPGGTTSRVLGATTSTGGAAAGDVEHPDPARANTSPATATVTKPRLRIIAAQITVTNRNADRLSRTAARTSTRLSTRSLTARARFSRRMPRHTSTARSPGRRRVETIGWFLGCPGS